jgi:hypothetical protein
MPHAPLTSEINLVESLSKVFAVALGVLYLLGFLVVAAYLSQFGVSSFSVLQLQYLLAGIWLLAHLCSIQQSYTHSADSMNASSLKSRENSTGVVSYSHCYCRVCL